MQAVYQDWAQSMQNLSLGAINHGIICSKNEPHPPSQGEFLAHCKKYHPESSVLKLESRLTEEQKEKNRERIAEIARNLAKRKQA